MKSLVEVSRRVSAVAAVLFLKRPEGYLPDITLGVTEETARKLRFAATEPFTQRLLTPRRTLALGQGVALTRCLGPKADPEDHRYMKRLIMVPATFRAQEGYLLLSFALESVSSIEKLLGKLLVQ